MTNDPPRKANGRKPAMNRRNNGWAGRVPLAMLAVLLAGAGGLRADVFPLEYRTNKCSARFSLPLGKTEVRFQKEPEYAGEQIVRSVLCVAPGKKEFVGFACDLEARKLYLDLNRNLDLTDDPDGVRTCGEDDYGREYPDIAISVEQGGRHREMVVDLQIYGESWGRYTVKSSWESDAVAIGGKPYRVSVVDNGDGVIGQEDTLFLEPMEKARKKSDAFARVELQAPTVLTVDGAPFDLSYAVSADGKSLALSVEPGQEKLVTVELAGEGVERLVMQDQGSAAVFFAPKSVIRLPAGRYRGSVRVRTGEGKNSILWEAFNVSRRTQGKDGESWLVGGPIVSKLTCSKSGSQLTFNQATTGAGGETYSLAGSSGKALGKPKLRVKKNGKIIHVGKFEYG